MPTSLRPSRTAATPVVPEPANGSQDSAARRAALHQTAHQLGRLARDVVLVGLEDRVGVAARPGAAATIILKRLVGAARAPDALALVAEVVDAGSPAPLVPCPRRRSGGQKRGQ